jgi:hypothetical protein
MNAANAETCAQGTGLSHAAKHTAAGELRTYRERRFRWSTVSVPIESFNYLHAHSQKGIHHQPAHSHLLLM